MRYLLLLLAALCLAGPATFAQRPTSAAIAPASLPATVSP